MIYLGTIVVANNQVQNNLTTATPFELRAGRIFIQPDDNWSSQQVALKLGPADAGFLPAAGEMWNPSTGSTDKVGREMKSAGCGTIAVRNGTMKVFAIPSSDC